MHNSRVLVRTSEANNPAVVKMPRPRGIAIYYFELNEVPDEGETFTYYEASPINPRIQTQSPNRFGNHTDFAGFPVLPETACSYKQVGELKLFCSSDTGIIEEDSAWHNPAKKRERTHGNGRRNTTSHGLISFSEDERGGPPSFWTNDELEGGGTRGFDLNWNCCDNAQPSTTLDISPSIRTR